MIRRHRRSEERESQNHHKQGCALLEAESSIEVLWANGDDELVFNDCWCCLEQSRSVVGDDTRWDSKGHVGKWGNIEKGVSCLADVVSCRSFISTLEQFLTSVEIRLVLRGYRARGFTLIRLKSSVYIPAKLSLWEDLGLLGLLVRNWRRSRWCWSRSWCGGWCRCSGRSRYCLGFNNR